MDKIIKRKIEGSENKELTPDSIASVLMKAKVEFHYFHIQTRGFAQHNALDTLYSEITDMADDIIECLLGRLGLRLGSLKLDPIGNYSDSEVKTCVSELHDFADKLFDYGTKNNYQDIANLAAELQQLLNKTRYRLTLS